MQSHFATHPGPRVYSIQEEYTLVTDAQEGPVSGPGDRTRLTAECRSRCVSERWDRLKILRRSRDKWGNRIRKIGTGHCFHPCQQVLFAAPRTCHTTAVIQSPPNFRFSFLISCFHSFLKQLHAIFCRILPKTAAAAAK